MNQPDSTTVASPPQPIVGGLVLHTPPPHLRRGHSLGPLIQVMAPRRVRSSNANLTDDHIALPSLDFSPSSNRGNTRFFLKRKEVCAKEEDEDADDADDDYDFELCRLALPRNNPTTSMTVPFSPIVTTPVRFGGQISSPSAANPLMNLPRPQARRSAEKENKKPRMV